MALPATVPAGYQGLAAAMIRQAAIDARRGDVLARVWLLDPGFTVVTDLMGIEVSPAHWSAWVVRGCPRIGMLYRVLCKVQSTAQLEQGATNNEPGEDGIVWQKTAAPTN
jgi:hypothetical protein